MINFLIKYFETSPGRSPVSDFFASLEEPAKTKIKHTVDLLREFGPNLGPPHAKKLSGTPLWELRILGQNNVRVFYVPIPDKNFLFLHGFIKKSEKTPEKETKTALKRLLQYRKVAIK